MRITTRRILLVLALCAGAPSGAAAQTITKLVLTAPSVSAGEFGCKTESHSFTSNTTPVMDTIDLAVVDSSGKPAKTPVELSLVIAGKIVKTLSVDSSALAYVTAKDEDAESDVAVATTAGAHRLCSVGPRKIPSDSILAAIGKADAHRLAFDSVAGDSWLILSLIKSISGEIPINEFFEARFKFAGTPPLTADYGCDSAIRLAKLRAVTRVSRDTTAAQLAFAAPKSRLLSMARTFDDTAKAAEWRRDLPGGYARCGQNAIERTVLSQFNWQRYFTAAAVDLPLSTDTASRYQIDDASFFLNWIVTSRPTPDSMPPRMTYLAGGFKVFDSRSYLGVGLGSMELKSSLLEGTSINVMYLHGFARDSTCTEACQQSKTAVDSSKNRIPLWDRDNLYLEVFLRVPKVQVFDRVRVRVGLLYPFGPAPAGEIRRQPEAKITLSVPIVDFLRF
jgi:hypothetical protein